MIKPLELKEILPIEKIQGKKMFNKDNDITIGFDVKLPEVFSQSKEDYLEFSKTMRMLIKELEPGDCFHSLNYYHEDYYVSNRTPINALEQENDRYYNGTPVPTSEHQMFFTKALKQRTAGVKDLPFSKTIKNFFSPPFKHKGELHDIERKLNSLNNRVTSIDQLKAKRLDNDALRQAIYRYWSLDYKNKDYNKNLLQPISCGDLLKVGDQYVYMMNIKEGAYLYSSKKHKGSSNKSYISNIELPNTDEVDLSMIYPISIGLPFNHIVSTHIERLDPKQTESSVFNDIAVNTMSLVDGQAEEMSKAKAKFKKVMAEQDLTPCRVNFTLIISDTDYYRLQKHIDLAKGALEGINECDAEILNDECLAQFLCNAPGNTKNQYSTFTNFIWQAVEYLPKEMHYHSDGNGYRLIDRYGAPRLIDLWNYPGITNRNGIIGGPSGKGKSATINYLCTEFLNNNGHLVILDKGHSYRDLCESYGGTYYDSSNMDKFRRNILLSKKDNKGNYTCDNMHLNFIHSIVSYIWKEGKLNEEPIEKNILKKLIRSYYNWINENKEVPVFESFYNYISIYSKNCEKEFHQYIDFTNLKLMLEPYAIGEKKELFNTDEDLDITNQRLVVFDVQAIEKEDGDYFNLVCLIVSNLVINKLISLDKSIRKCFIIDEALSFLKGDMGDFIGDLYAVIRKEKVVSHY